MDNIRLHINNLEDTERLGNVLGSLAKAGDVICLDGELGAGKTALSQAIARGIGVEADYYVTSPSFAILHEYPGRLPMYHMDFYRLQDASEVEDLGFEEYFYLTGLSVIEWSKRAEEILPKERLNLEIYVNEDQTRTVTLKASNRYVKMVQHIRLAFSD